MSYVDPDTIYVPVTGTVVPAAVLAQYRDNFEFLIDPPVCSVSGSGQSVANNTPAVLNAPSEAFDNDVMHSTVSNTSRITIQTAGRYLFTCTVRFSADTTTGVYRIVRFLVDGVTSHVVGSIPPVSDGATVTVISGAKLLALSAAQFVEVEVQHTAGEANTVVLSEFGALFLTRA